MIESYRDNDETTIVACATPIAPSAIAVIRISGPKSVKLLKSLTGESEFLHGMMKNCILDTGELKDRIMAAAFYAPRSYTGEDSVELYTHGSPVVVSSVISFCLKNGARLAQGGEFTLRAYLNGKFDLSAAEGINDLIHAETVSQANAAYSISEGRIGKICQTLSKQLVSVAAAIQAGLDYPEEGVEIPLGRDLSEELVHVRDELKKLTDSYDSGRKLSDGIKVVFTGKVNAGKSSLFNAILGSERAIVDESEGTTRDSIDAMMEYRGMKFVLTDTAGFRKTDNVVENKGIIRTQKLISEADVIIQVLGKDDIASEIENSCAITLRARPRADCGVLADKDEFSVSSVTGEGIDELKQAIYQKASQKGLIPREDAITDFRHYSAFKDCLDSVDALIEEYDFVTDDIKTLRLRDALDSLGSVTGLIGSEEILNEIFSSFCVGK